MELISFATREGAFGDKWGHYETFSLACQSVRVGGRELAARTDSSLDGPAPRCPRLLANPRARPFPPFSPRAQARPLVMLLKAYLTKLKLHDTFTGGLGSYCLVLLVISHIQVCPVRSLMPLLAPALLGGVVRTACLCCLSLFSQSRVPLGADRGRTGPQNSGATSNQKSACPCIRSPY